MRIVAGGLKGRRLAAPAGRDIRPTADRTRQALFDVLEHGHLIEGGGSAVVDGLVLDAFCGTGALGLEALSRGAAEATFMDSNRAALDCDRKRPHNSLSTRPNKNSSGSNKWIECSSSIRSS